mgnify:CR=1 FL=1
MGDIDLGLESSISSQAQPQAEDYNLLAPPNSGGAEFSIPDCLVSPRIMLQDEDKKEEELPDVLINVEESK